ncbi:hypothetical protein, partial [Pseudoalteromonas sp. BMB]|uniref:hypothetical protein n=1 Tax=Pseudoalteromonas sp. BMB TaxID=1874619 RepID=UPI001C2F259E
LFRSGKCKEETLKRSLTTWGEKFSQDEIEEALSEAPIDGNGLIDIKKFAQILTKGAEEEGA